MNLLKTNKLHTMKMKTGKITAKLRDAVPVCLMVNGEELQISRARKKGFMVALVNALGG